MGGFNFLPMQAQGQGVAAGGMANLGQLLQLLGPMLQKAFQSGGAGGGMAAPGAAGVEPAANGWMGLATNPLLQRQRGRGGNALAPSVPGAPQNLLDIANQSGGGGGGNIMSTFGQSAGAGAGEGVPMGNLLTMFKGGAQGPGARLNMMQLPGIEGAAGNAGRPRNRISQAEPPYGGGRAAQPTFWQGPNGNRSFALTAK